MLHACCEKIGRDPSEITVSTHLLMWPSKTVADVVTQAEAFAEVGLELGIVYLEAPVAPSVIGDLAAALQHLH